MTNQLDSFQAQLLEDLKHNLGRKRTPKLSTRAVAIGGSALIACAITGGIVAANILTPPRRSQ